MVMQPVPGLGEKDIRKLPKALQEKICNSPYFAAMHEQEEETAGAEPDHMKGASCNWYQFTFAVSLLLDCSKKSLHADSDADSGDDSHNSDGSGSGWYRCPALTDVLWTCRLDVHDQVVELLRRRKMTAYCGLAKTLVERLMGVAKIRATAACVSTCICGIGSPALHPSSHKLL
ncbi:hypothetical protein BCR44DRAFT_1214575 [Catenaria anguillulae PL171]|uniref:Uncharacterized protein n=1 Tax=Catenaria anguillulae PL171 TaxID=765915 RepID=A0A1Y2HYM9_9FUNG|nr:hypothetical protein BCR44DRAFT_1214575 [Catenaria anguillulae PL171]